MKSLAEYMICEYSEAEYYIFVVYGMEEQNMEYVKDVKLVRGNTRNMSVGDMSHWIQDQEKKLKKKDGQDWKFSGLSNENAKVMKDKLKEIQKNIKYNERPKMLPQ